MVSGQTRGGFWSNQGGGAGHGMGPHKCGISMNLTRDKATWCIAWCFCILPFMTQKERNCHKSPIESNLAENCVIQWSNVMHFLSDLAALLCMLTFHVYVNLLTPCLYFYIQRGGRPKLLHSSAAIYSFCSWQNEDKQSCSPKEDQNKSKRVLWNDGKTSADLVFNLTSDPMSRWLNLH